MLRQFRNTILDGGWNCYRRPEVCHAATRALAPLAEKDEVEPEDVTAAFDLLLTTGMRPLPSFDLVGDPEEDDQEDGQEAAEVPG